VPPSSAREADFFTATPFVYERCHSVDQGRNHKSLSGN
jgi:hypothetical protein